MGKTNRTDQGLGTARRSAARLLAVLGLVSLSFMFLIVAADALGSSLRSRWDRRTTPLPQSPPSKERQTLLGHLTVRFTCYLPSWRGRGLTDDHPDLGFGRMVDDIIAYVDSIGEPTGLVGRSAGADMALAAAGAQPDAVDALALIEPVMPPLMDEHQRAALGAAIARTRELAAEGRLADAARAFAGVPFNDEDIAAAEDAGYFEAAGRYVTNLLNFSQQQMGYEGSTPDDPAVLGAISARVLVLHGSKTKPYATAAARHAAAYVSNARIQEIPGAGHAALLTHSEALAGALTGFFSSSQQPA